MPSPTLRTCRGLGQELGRGPFCDVMKVAPSCSPQPHWDMQRPAASRAPWRRGRLTYRVLSFGGSLLRLQDHRVGLSQRLPTSGQRTKQASNGIALLAEPCLDLSICVQSVGFSRAPLWSVSSWFRGGPARARPCLEWGRSVFTGASGLPPEPHSPFGIKDISP